MKYLLMIVLFFSFGQAKALDTVEPIFSGNDLLGWCESSQDKPLCDAYVAGVNDFHSQVVMWNMATPLFPLWCLSVGVSVGQMSRIVTKYMREQPSGLHMSAAKQVEAALYHAFPCE
jgi:hypothetical protein